MLLAFLFKKFNPLIIIIQSNINLEIHLKLLFLLLLVLLKSINLKLISKWFLQFLMMRIFILKFHLAQLHWKFMRNYQRINYLLFKLKLMQLKVVLQLLPVLRQSREVLEVRFFYIKKFIYNIYWLIKVLVQE